ncbi:unnamed protein product [Phyllotreta striolata]|uniref:Uncharacterized protein n=1 Tax=Phyllotreta striolata TaxID=444603 RepID=A0A9P0DQX1_PHYSR|nr:unnamed protein product [Phyllotreta striolata]
MNTEKVYEAVSRLLRLLEREKIIHIANLDNLKSFFGISTVFFCFQDYSAFKMNTEKTFERLLEREKIIHIANLDNLKSFFDISTVFFCFQDYSAFKMNTEKVYEAVSRLLRDYWNAKRLSI